MHDTCIKIKVNLVLFHNSLLILTLAQVLSEDSIFLPKHGVE